MLHEELNMLKAKVKRKLISQLRQSLSNHSRFLSITQPLELNPDASLNNVYYELFDNCLYSLKKETGLDVKDWMYWYMFDTGDVKEVDVEGEDVVRIINTIEDLVDVMEVIYG